MEISYSNLTYFQQINNIIDGMVMVWCINAEQTCSSKELSMLNQQVNHERMLSELADDDDDEY